MQACFNKPHRVNPSVRRAKSLTGLGLLPTGHVSLQSQIPECDPLPREAHPRDFPHGKGKCAHKALCAPDSAGLRVSLGASPTGTNPTSHKDSCRSSCLQ